MSVPGVESLNPVWWTDPWWEDVLYQKECSLSLEQIRASIEHLKRLFDREWVQAAFQSGPPNAIIPILYGGKGLWPFQDLMWLSGIAAGVRGIPGVQRLLRDLSGEKTWSTLLELEVASWLNEMQWEVTFLKPGPEGRTPDLEVQKNGISTAIECKRFGSEQWEEWAQQLSMRVIHAINAQALHDAPCFDVLLEPRLSDLVWDDAQFRVAAIDELADRIAVTVREALRSVSPRSMRIPGIGEIRLRPDVQGSGFHAIGGIEVSPQAKMRRIVRNGVLEAAQQLQHLGPGAAVIKSDFTSPKELVDVTLCSLNRADSTLLRPVGVVVITGTMGAPPVIWQNPFVSDHPATGSLTRAFVEALSSRPG
jgi:hypothetical protein